MDSRVASRSTTPTISAHYENNQASYQTNETVDLEYVELALADIAANIDISDEAVAGRVRTKRATVSRPPRNVAHGTS